MTGLAAFLWIAFLRSGERHLQHPEELANATHAMALLLQSLLALPFLAGAWASRRWPRTTGLLLLGVSAFFGGL